MEYFEINKVYSFMDYIKGGLQVHCTVAIDFTGLVKFNYYCMKNIFKNASRYCLRDY